VKRQDVDQFEKIKVQLDSLHEEMSVLAKKSPNDAVNVFKIRLINTTLEICNELFGAKHKPFADFDKFNMDELPSNSDVTFIIAQYIECAEKFRSDNIHQDSIYWYWDVDDDEEEEVRTTEPRKLRG
jgi:hypothetical protein